MPLQLQNQTGYSLSPRSRIALVLLVLLSVTYPLELHRLGHHLFSATTDYPLELSSPSYRQTPPARQEQDACYLLCMLLATSLSIGNLPTTTARLIAAPWPHATFIAPVVAAPSNPNIFIRAPPL